MSLHEIKRIKLKDQIGHEEDIRNKHEELMIDDVKMNFGIGRSVVSFKVKKITLKNENMKHGLLRKHCEGGV